MTRIIDVTLCDNDDFRLYTFLPKGDTFTVIGRTDLYIGAKAVECVEGSTVTLVEGGEITIYSEAPVTVSANGTTLPLTRMGKRTRVSLSAGITEIEVLESASAE